MPNNPKKGITNLNVKFKTNLNEVPTEINKPSSSRNEVLRHKALQDKVFYFDFKNATTATWLEKEIRKLGGRVEYFFGKEVQYLITDKPQTLTQNIPPCSPFSNGPSPHFSRPDTSQSIIGPYPSDWAYSEQWRKHHHSSRANKMMELASINKSQGSCDVLSRARERGTIIKTVEQITSWLNTVHKKLGTNISQEILKEPPKNPSRRLRGQYLKIQDKTNKYKPQILETTQWQTIDVETISDRSPFTAEKRRLTRKQANEMHSKVPGKKSQPVKNVTSKNKKGSNTGKGLIKRKGGGKCEGCNMRFDNVEKHLLGEQHIRYAKKDKNFEAIDNIISDGLSLETFLANLAPKDTFVKKPVTHVLSPHITSLGESSTEPLDIDGPCTRARKHKYNCLVVENENNITYKETLEVSTFVAPSPKLGLLPEIENNYYLRSTPRKLVGMLDTWDTPNSLVSNENNQVSERNLLVELQCQSLDLYSSQGAITPGEYVGVEKRVHTLSQESVLSKSPPGLSSTPSASLTVKKTHQSYRHRSQSPPRISRTRSSSGGRGPPRDGRTRRSSRSKSKSPARRSHSSGRRHSKSPSRQQNWTASPPRNSPLRSKRSLMHGLKQNSPLPSRSRHVTRSPAQSPLKRSPRQKDYSNSVKRRYFNHS